MSMTTAFALRAFRPGLPESRRATTAGAAECDKFSTGRKFVRAADSGTTWHSSFRRRVCDRMNEPPPRRADRAPGMVPGWGGTCFAGGPPPPLYLLTADFFVPREDCKSEKGGSHGCNTDETQT